MKVSDLSKTRLVEEFLAAGKELGYETLDVNGKSQLGKKPYLYFQLVSIIVQIC